MDPKSGGDDDDLRPPFLPEVVLIQILAWLPVISLLRFKSVCKSWRALIQSPYFVNLHITTTSNFDTFILQTLEERDRWMSDVIKMITVSSGSGGGTGEDKVFYFHDLEFSSCCNNDWNDWMSSMYLLGSCNGLICTHNLRFNDVSLWNPATRQFRVLPKPITLTIEEQQKEGIASLGRDFVAFGFDVKTKDYKVLQITPLYLREPKGKECRCRVQVYSLSTDSWRLLEDINYLPIVPEQNGMFNHGIYMNGSYFFVGIIFSVLAARALENGSLPLCTTRLMMSFDFTKEIFTTMQFPDHDDRHRLVLSYLGDKIALFTSRLSTDDNKYNDIWLLNEHDCGIVNKESWTKLYSFQRNFRVLPEPICILNGGEFALITCKTDDGQWAKLQFFNLVTKEVENDIIVCNEVLRADVYNQSLVPIMGGNVAAADR